MKLTNETILATRIAFADNALACIAEVESGEVKVNDEVEYFAWRMEQFSDALAGRYDHSMAFLQRAHYLQTGECPALLP